MKKICILGLGYIGLPTAAMFAAHGLEVVGVDINPEILEGLLNGEPHIQELGLQPMVQQAIQSGRMRIKSAPETADAFIIAVPTPFVKESTLPESETGFSVAHYDRKADMRYVVSAAEAIIPVLRRSNLVILESTSPPRTTLDLVKPILERSGLLAGPDFHLAYSPERVLPGRILQELVENARVIGGIDRQSAEAGRELYSLFVRGEIVLTDTVTAEMVKLMENTYRDVNIAIANEFSRLADRFGVDVWEAIHIANRHPRVKILNPGPGVGGHCISVDPWFLVEAAPDLSPLIRTARQVNDAQPAFIQTKIERALGGLAGRKIAVLGLAYKADVDDLRESPATAIAEQLAHRGALVSAYEPHKPAYAPPGVEAAGSLANAVAGCELIAFLVGHQAFRQLTPARLKALTPARLALDAVGILNPVEWRQAGFKLIRLGAG